MFRVALSRTKRCRAT